MWFRRYGELSLGLDAGRSLRGTRGRRDRRPVGVSPTDCRAICPAGRARRSRSPPEQIQIDIAFRVIADHIRTLSFAIADGIQPGNNDRNYVLRRILRRAVRYGRTLGFHEPFFYKLVDVLAETMGDVFPEIRAKKKHVQEVIRNEEEAFNKTLDRGIELFEVAVGEYRVKSPSHREVMKSLHDSRPIAGIVQLTRASKAKINQFKTMQTQTEMCSGRICLQALRHLRLSARPD